MTRFLVLVALGCFVLLVPRVHASDSDDITALARQFLLDANMGDLEKFADICRPGDVVLIPKPRSPEAADMMKMKDRPEMLVIRQKIAEEITNAFLLQQPVIAADGKTATLWVQPVQAEGRKFFELKAVYNMFMGQVYTMSKQGKPLPTLEEVQASVLAKDSIQQKLIEQKAGGFAKDTALLTFEKTVAGWKLNLQALFGQAK
jgi:hypothetical protein